MLNGVLNNVTVTGQSPTSVHVRSMKPGECAYMAGTNEIVMRVYVDDVHGSMPWLIRLRDGDTYKNPEMMVIPIGKGKTINIVTG